MLHPSHSAAMRVQVLTLDAIWSAALGLVLFFAPHVVADFIFERQTDGVHWHLIRCVASFFIATSFVSYHLRNAHRATHTLCFLIRIIPCIICLMLVLQCRSMTPELIAPAYLEFAKYLLCAGLVFNTVFLIASGFHIGTTLLPDHKIGNCLLQLDSLLSICVGIAWLTFPKWLLHKQVLIPLDESHELCARIMGSWFVASYIGSAQALKWSNSNDRMKAIDGRIICCLGIGTAQVWSQLAYLDSWSEGHWVGITVSSTWTVIATLYRLSLFYSTKTKTM